MLYIKPPFFLQWFNPDQLLCEVPVNEKVIYITFDDGPDPETTPVILEILEKFNARATFFMVGDNIRRYPGLPETVKEKGHGTGNHTFHHLNGWRTPPGAYLEDIERCRNILDTKLFRPPYGKISLSQFLLLRKQYKIVFWSVLTYDFHSGISGQQCLEIALKYSRPGSVVVFHDHSKSIEKVRYVLPRYLDHFCERGYRFKPIPV